MNGTLLLELLAFSTDRLATLFTSMAKKSPSSSTDQYPVRMQFIERRIYRVHGKDVMRDSDLAELYQVPTFRLNEAVKRNRDRFLMFQLTQEEAGSLTSQFAMSKPGRGGRRTLPYVFTEHGVAMLASVLNSDRAVQMNIIIIRAFIKMRELLATHKDLATKIEKLQAGQRDHALAIGIVAKDIQNLANGVKREFKKLKSPRRRKPHIGFYTDDKQ
jgi:hypothetical protein